MTNRSNLMPIGETLEPNLNPPEDHRKCRDCGVQIPYPHALCEDCKTIRNAELKGQDV